MISLQDKVVIITGGGRGIGFGLSTAFAKAGAKLVITGRTESTLLSAKEKLEAAHGCEVLCVTADGADEAAIQNVIDKTVERFGKIDAVVNNAQASASGKMLVDHTKEDLFGDLRDFLLYAKGVSLPQRNQGLRGEFCQRRGLVWAYCAIVLCGGKGRYPRTFARGGDRMGALRRARQRNLSACYDRGFAEVQGRIPRTLRTDDQRRAYGQICRP